MFRKHFPGFLRVCVVRDVTKNNSKEHIIFMCQFIHNNLSVDDESKVKIKINTLKKMCLYQTTYIRILEKNGCEFLFTYRHLFEVKARN